MSPSKRGIGDDWADSSREWKDHMRILIRDVLISPGHPDRWTRWEARSIRGRLGILIGPSLQGGRGLDLKEAGTTGIEVNMAGTTTITPRKNQPLAIAGRMI